MKYGLLIVPCSDILFGDWRHGKAVDENSDELNALVQRLKDGDVNALGELFTHYRERLRRMVNLRLDPRLHGRVSSSDILQETYLDAQQRVKHFVDKPEMPFAVWLRLIASQRLVDVHRQHLGAKMRNAGCEVPLQGGSYLHASSLSLAEHLARESPSQVAMKKELLALVEQALDEMEPLDREVLALRHFEELTNDEVAEILNIQKSAASNRYVRALRRLKDALPKIQEA